MKGLTRRTRVALAVLVAAVAGGVAAGVVLARGNETGSALAQGPAGVVGAGEFRSVIWSTRGTASLVRTGSGRLKIRFSRDFRTQAAPELYVYVGRYDRGRFVRQVRVAPLKNAAGAQEYSLPAGAVKRLGVSVAVFCEKCNKVWGDAKLQAPRGDALG